MLARRIIFSLLLTASSAAWSGELEGLWQEYDDDTGKLAALIRIEKNADNLYQGSIEKVIANNGNDSESLCSKCTGALHNRPLSGLRILSGMKRKDGQNFEGGEILDPDDGKAYPCRIRLSSDGKSIEVRGYVNNFNLIGQSEIWRRAN